MATALAWLGTACPVQSAVVELARPQVDGTPLYSGAAARIYLFDDGDAMVDAAQVVSLLDTHRGAFLHCERMAEPPGREGLLQRGGLAVRYVRTGNGAVYFDWASRTPVELVKVRAARESYVYAYAAGGTHADAGLRTPAIDVDHASAPRMFEFCFAEPAVAPARDSAISQRALQKPEPYDCIRMVRTFGLDSSECWLDTAYAGAADGREPRTSKQAGGARGWPLSLLRGIGL